MANRTGPLRDIAWNDIFPGLVLLRIFRLAADPRKVVIASLALVLTIYGWRGIDLLFPGNPAAEQLLSGEGALLPEIDEAAAEEPPVWLVVNPILTPWEHLSRPFRWIFDPEMAWISLAVTLLCAVWVAIVWSIFGAVITRIAAVELSREERLSLANAFSHARRRAISYASAVLLPLLGVTVAALLFAVVPGLMLRSDDFGLLGFAVLYPLVLLLVGLPAAVLLLGLALGWPLMWAAISVEASDAFDAISRSYAYTFQRPLHYALYALGAGILGLFVWAVVVIFVVLVVQASIWGLGWGSGHERVAEVIAWSQQDAQWPLVKTAVDVPRPETMGPAGNFAVRLIALTLGFVKLLMLGFVYSYFWTAATAIYLLLRRATDATEMDNVYLEEPPEVAPLPPLRTDEAGVPVLAEDEPVTTASE